MLVQDIHAHQALPHHPHNPIQVVVSEAEHTNRLGPDAPRRSPLVVVESGQPLMRPGVRNEGKGQGTDCEEVDCSGSSDPDCGVRVRMGRIIGLSFDWLSRLHDSRVTG